ncbi:hypothetical protein J2Z60_000290 [Lactobacillus colini]|uniref:SCP domain-containing protein n=1 Tax=Lactobacillus colini TaxID=1819254 RepID=A0ABS4MBT1_9LACO|nr:SLAP domain-containing protein [Lactobacillus colini]MBP2057128.1 hypothetical protein [Lactobacillus colini]
MPNTLKKGTKLYAGTSHATYGKVATIKNSKMYRIGRNQYVKLANFTYSSNNSSSNSSSTKSLFTVNVTGAGMVHTSPNGEGTHEALFGKRKVFEEKYDSNNVMWYRIGNNKWIISTDTDTPKGSISSTSESNTEKADTGFNNSSTTAVQVTNNTQSNTSKSSTNVQLTPAIIKQTEEEFVKLVNNWRASQGLAPVTIDSSLDSYALQRAKHDATAWDATQQPDYHQGASIKYYEISYLVDLSTPDKMAKDAFNTFVYNDASANWGHRDTLKSTDLKTLTVSLAMTHNNGYYKNGVAIVGVGN